MTDFVWGTVGALAGGGAVWGRMTSKIEQLEKGQTELKAEIDRTRNELREDVRELRALIVERLK